MPRFLRLLPSLLALLAAPISCNSSGTSGNNPDQSVSSDGGADMVADQVVSSFAFMGCNRLEAADWNVATNPSSANLAQLSQTFADVAALSPLPSHFLFIGDLVLNEAGDNGVTLTTQLNGWAQLAKSDPSKLLTKLTLLPVVGNHETLKVSGGSEVPDLPTYNVWNTWLTSNSFDPPQKNGPTMASPNLDMLITDQSKDSFSFDIGSSHLVVINTDTPTITNTAGQLPFYWLQSDVTAAQANPSVANIFILGHKPISDTLGSTTSDRIIDPPMGTKLQMLISSNKKVRAYLAAHDHTWYAGQIGTSGAYQVIAGNAGSKVDPSFYLTSSGSPFYGFTVVRIYRSGSVGIVSYGRPIPSPYNAATTVAATARPEMPLPTR